MSAARISAAEAKRSSGHLASARAITSSIDRAMGCGARSPTRGGARRQWACNIEIVVGRPASKGPQPASSSNRHNPTA